MDLVIHEVNQLQDVHVPDADRRVERFAGTAIEESRLPDAVDHHVTVAVRNGVLQNLEDLVLARTVKHGCGDLRPRRGPCGSRALEIVKCVPSSRRGPPEVRLEHLTEVHPGGNTKWRQNDVDRSAVREERHVVLRQDLRDHTFVAMAAGEFVAL